MPKIHNDAPDVRLEISSAATPSRSSSQGKQWKLDTLSKSGNDRQPTLAGSPPQPVDPNEQQNALTIRHPQNYGTVTPSPRHPLTSPGSATSSLLLPPTDVESASLMHRQRVYGAKAGALLGLTLSTMVGAQMIRRVEEAEPDSAVLLAMLTTLGMAVAGQYWLENAVRVVTVGAREALGSVLRSSLWATRWPDKAADWTASLSAGRLNGDWASEQMLLHRFPAEPYPVHCRGEMQVPGCGDPYGYELAKLHAPYWYAGWGMAVGAGMGAIVGQYAWKPCVTDGVKPLIFDKGIYLAQIVHHAARDAEQRPPSDSREAKSLIWKAVSKTLAGVVRRGTSWAAPTTESHGT